MEKKLRVGIIGCGRIAVMHLNASTKLPQSILVACCDTKIDRANLACEKYGGKAYTDYKEMIAKENLDVVHICLPHDQHVEASVYALEKGLNVLCEKPMSIDYESAVKSVEVGKKSGKKHGIIFQCRYNPATFYIVRKIKEGKLGKLISAHSLLTWSRPEEVHYVNSEWKGTWDKAGGGVLIDQAIHSIDLVNWIINSEVESLKCTMSKNVCEKIAVEDTATGVINYKNGVRYVFYATNTYPFDEPIKLELRFENGKMEFNFDDVKINYKDGATEEFHAESRYEKVEGAKDYWTNAHIVQVEQFYNSVLGNCELEITAESVLPIHKMIFDLYKSAKSQETKI